MKPSLKELLQLWLFGGVATRLSKTFRPDYQTYIRSASWKRKAASIRCRDGHKCRLCGGHGYEVHHVTYKRLGFELPADLLTLCRDCHEKQPR